jgi:cellulose synthase/poly-beta-1,6-N-acetylglucosamine synthase-like glycosyltransferase
MKLDRFEFIFAALFWLCLAEVAYTFVGYPFLLILAGAMSQVIRDIRYALRRHERRPSSRPVHSETDSPPGVSLVFAAHNEALVIGDKMKNCEQLDYPRELLEIVIGCDACDDGTPEAAQAYGLANVRVEDYRERSGKPGVLNRTIPGARHEIVVLSDANTMLEPDAVSLLARHFSDPRVGCVCGELRFTTREGAVKSEGAYWRYEQILKFFESRMNMMVGANGGVFAIRRDLFEPLPRFAIIDDFLIAMQIRSRGYKVVYDPQAVAYEETGADARLEFQRRIRIGAGAYHAMRYTWRMLLPTAGSVCFSYWSHKVMRWVAPFALAIALLSAILLSAHPFYLVCAAVGLSAALAAWYGYREEVHGRRIAGVFAIPYYFLSMNLALMLGFFRFVSGAQTSIWRRTAR